ncbi:hypothetical protein [Microbacterium mangrovi]
MMRRRRQSGSQAQAPRPPRHDRHGRAGRSLVTKPPLPPLDNRIDRFDMIAGSTAEFLRSVTPELRDVRYEFAALPLDEGVDGIQRWKVIPEEQRIVLFRIPIQRLSHLHRNDDLHRRFAVEEAVLRASAEYLGVSPWDLGPGRFHGF